ncbi:MAG: radical SAM protein [Archaeoglobaceae archaeon]
MRIFDVEFNPFVKKYSKNVKRVALVYPNRYVGGISNLGMQYIYFAINELEGPICERFYADVFDGFRSLESGTPLNKFDLALFSLQYELDYFKAVEIAKKFSGLKIAGGPCVMINPLPIKKYFDAFFIGECEDYIQEIVKAKRIEDLEGIPGIYTGKEDKVKRIHSELGKHIEREIIGDGAYGRCFLLEIGRGCIRKCRFCVVRQIYSPPRWRKIEDLPEVKYVEKVAIIAPSPTDHPQFKEIVERYTSLGFQVSPSSIRADAVDEELLEILSRTSNSLTLAPETASEKLSEILQKNISFEDIISVAEMSKGRFEKIKLYYMIGLPGESFEDVLQILDQAEKVKKIVGRVEISVNPLIPKPHTPMQWLPFGGKVELRDGIDELRKKMKLIKKECRKRGIELQMESLKEFEVQAVLSRGEEDVSKIFERQKIDFEKYLGAIEIENTLPWDFIDHGYSKERLKKEYEKIWEILNSEAGNIK